MQFKTWPMYKVDDAFAVTLTVMHNTGPNTQICLVAFGPTTWQKSAIQSTEVHNVRSINLNEKFLNLEYFPLF